MWVHYNGANFDEYKSFNGARGSGINGANENIYRWSENIVFTCYIAWNLLSAAVLLYNIYKFIHLLKWPKHNLYSSNQPFNLLCIYLFHYTIKFCCQQ